MIHLKMYIIILFTCVVLLTSCNTNFRFIQISDPQFGFINENKGFSEETELYEKAVIKINDLDPAAVIVTGDLVHDRGNKSQWEEFGNITSRINSRKVYVTPGNHDTGQEPTAADLKEYTARFGYDRFSFRYKKCQFIGFNSSIIKAQTPVPEEEQFQWLKNELSNASDARFIFLFCHHPFFIKDPGEPEEYFNIKPDVRVKYMELFSKYGVDAIFAGHLHRNAISRSGDIEMITTSSAGKQLGNDLPGFRLVKVTRTGFSHEYISTGN